MCVGRRMKKLIGGLLGLFVFVCGSAQATINDLFISEYVEGSGYNKAIELFNGNSRTIDLSDYKLEFYLNGATKANFSINLSGYLTAYTTFVIANSLAASEILIVSDQTRNSIWFDGDDVVTLTYKNQIIDSIGQVGLATDKAWGNSPTRVKNSTLRRSPSVERADTDITDKVDFIHQWHGHGANNFDGLGSYIIVGAGLSACSELDKAYHYC